MRASEFIKSRFLELQKLIDEHGDMPVRCHAGDDVDADIIEIVAYDSDGNSEGECVEFYVHF